MEAVPGAWLVNGHQLAESRVSGTEDDPFLVCQICWMYCTSPQYAHRGLGTFCQGSGGGAKSKKGSRAQARNDFARNLLPGKEKPPIDDLVWPTEATRRRWAKALGASFVLEGSKDPEASGDPPPSGHSAAASLGERGRASAVPGPTGLFLPGLEGALSSMGFSSAEDARARGRLARAAKARDPRPEVGQREE